MGRLFLPDRLGNRVQSHLAVDDEARRGVGRKESADARVPGTGQSHPPGGGERCERLRAEFEGGGIGIGQEDEGRAPSLGRRALPGEPDGGLHAPGVQMLRPPQIRQGAVGLPEMAQAFRAKGEMLSLGLQRHPAPRVDGAERGHDVSPPERPERLGDETVGPGVFRRRCRSQTRCPTGAWPTTPPRRRPAT